ncbi:transmembrane and ubiquitin-like domain-containing protein 1 isoform X2 [Pleurodeles waltl]|uniref:transmembrane and ubiquitin-like domain-containing protein 1 isoform X2 n=1 Tax=Pleurodeles waltl TaxID=8319 RepID=UPI003709B7DA
MALIEGIGDEVTILFGIVFCFLVLVLSWVSTHTNERSEQLFVPVVSDVGAVGTPRLSEVPVEPVVHPECFQEQKNDGDETSAPSASSAAAETAPPDTGDDTFRGLRHRVSSTSLDVRSSPTELFEETDSGQEATDSSAGQTMVLRLKFLNDTERLARVRPEDTVSFLKRTFFPGQEHQVRLIYQGQLLRDDTQTMSSLHLTDHCVLHCHISQHATPQMPAGARVDQKRNYLLHIRTPPTEKLQIKVKHLKKIHVLQTVPHTNI